MNSKYLRNVLILILFILALTIGVDTCGAQSLESIIQDKYDMNVKLYPHLNYNWEMFINDGDFIGEFHTLWKLGLPFEEQSNKFMKWYNKEFKVVAKVKNNDTLVYVAIGLIMLDIVINRVNYRNNYLHQRYPDR